jgi:hypothetical protein
MEERNENNVSVTEVFSNINGKYPYSAIACLLLQEAL